MSKIFTIAVGAAGYVLGSRAGRERFEQIKTQANKVWSNPKVQQAASDVQDLAADKAPVVKEKAAAAAHKASSKVSRAKTAPDGSQDEVEVIEFPAAPGATPGSATHG